MEDIVKLYSHAKENDRHFQLYDKKFNIMSDKLIRLKQMIDIK